MKSFTQLLEASLCSTITELIESEEYITMPKWNPGTSPLTNKEPKPKGPVGDLEVNPHEGRFAIKDSSGKRFGHVWRVKSDAHKQLAKYHKTKKW